MRVFVVCIALVLALAATSDANAQRREEPQPRSTQPTEAQPQRAQRAVEPAQRTPVARQFVVQPASGDFQRRRPADKQATLKLFQIEITPQQLGETFTLTARAPYVANRGSLESNRAIHTVRQGEPAKVTLMGVEAFAEVHVEDAHMKRFLIECQAQTSAGLRLTPSWSDHPILIEGYQKGGLYSIITPVIGTKTASVKLHRPFVQGALIEAWVLNGCEVTRFQ